MSVPGHATAPGPEGVGPVKLVGAVGPRSPGLDLSLAIPLSWGQYDETCDSSRMEY